MACNVARSCHRMDDHAAQCLWSVPVRPELERGDRAEITAAAALRPEQIGILRLAGVARFPIRSDDVDRNEVIRGVAALARSPSKSPAHRKSGNPGVRDDATWNSHAEGLRLVIDVSPGGATLCAH